MSSRSASFDPDEPIEVGRVLRAHGVRGEVRVEVESDVPGRFDVGAELRLTAANGSDQRLRVAHCRPDRGTLLVHFDGVDDRDRAEELRGGRLSVPASRVPEPPAGFYYHFQLVGCGVVDRHGGDLGRVAEVVEDGGGSLLRVSRGKRSLLVPFVDAFLVEVDVDGQRIEVDLPPGLVETCTS